MNFRNRINYFLTPVLIVLAAIAFVPANAAGANENAVVANNGGLGVIKGIVRDEGGIPIADATVAIFRVGTSKLLKQVRSASDGSFLAKIVPGTYTILAVAQGFNPVTLSEVEVDRASQLTYGFKLERVGSGNTLPEKRLDRNNPKWVIRSAQTSRSIYQNTEGETPASEQSPTENGESEVDEEQSSTRRGQTVAETYFGGSDSGAYSGVNVATLLPLADNAELLLAGQAGIGRNVPQRIEAQLKFRPSDAHQIRFNTSIANLGSVAFDNKEKTLGQLSFQALDEWKVREGVILVFGVDYSRFIGAGNDFSISPRLGLQYDIDAKTRFRTAYTTQTEERTWARAIELEDAQVIFREPVAIEDFVLVAGKPLMNKSTRFEFGIERVLDNDSSVEANVFFDTTLGRGIGMTSIPFDSLSGEFSEFVGNQQGNAQGMRVVYTRRLGGYFSTSAGYSFGSGQKLTEAAFTNPAELFQTGFFQSFFGQFEADLKTGTSVKTIFRLSPQATVFAIDPFQGRLAIYDPSLSVLVTQNLPTLGLPFHAEAIVDARNVFNFQNGILGEKGELRLHGQRRALRGGILVRF